MRIGRFLGLTLAAVIAPFCLGADSDLELSFKPLFAGTTQPEVYAPYLIRCVNKGESTKGVFTFSDENSKTEYPVDLPKGGKKEFIAYLPKAGYEQVTGRLVTDIGTARIKFPEVSGSANCLLSISDTEGLLNFARSLEGANGRMGYSFSPLSASPSLLPDRATSYLSFSGVFLNEGAERIEGDQLAALERYVLLGGTLVISGGASAPIFNDPRWSHLLPIKGVRPETIRPQPGEGVAGLEMEGDFTMSVGTLAPGALVRQSFRNRPFLVVRPYGFGRVYFIAVNLFEDPVSKWQGKPAIISAMNLGDTTRRIAGVQAAAMMNDQEDPYGSGMSVHMMTPPTTPEQNDPFSASVPPTSTVMWILLGYFVLVVPLNLLILRKFGKGELAWITSPVLSLGFAVIFFRFAADLYSAQLSTATTGLLIADVNSKQAYFLGGSQLFFPRGGRYDLGLAGVEGIRSRSSDPYGRSAKAIGDFNPIDTGQINVPNLMVPNLSFREFAYYEARKDQLATIASIGKDSLRIVNTSGKKITKGILFYEGGVTTIKDLNPGQTEEVRLVNSGRPYYDQGYDIGMASISDLLTNQSRGNRVALFAEIEGVEAGPRIGKLVKNLSKTRVVIFGTRGSS